MKLKASEIAECTRGAVTSGSPDTLFTGISTDSRAIRNGDLFVALGGEKFDGHVFVSEAVSKGAAGSIVMREGIHGKGTVITVEIPDRPGRHHGIREPVRRDHRRHHGLYHGKTTVRGCARRSSLSGATASRRKRTTTTSSASPDPVHAATTPWVRGRDEHEPLRESNGFRLSPGPRIDPHQQTPILKRQGHIEVI